MSRPGVYIHIPFCLRKCLYCDFNSYDCMEQLKKPYVEALVKEICQSGVAEADTAFIGGGTPTCLDIELLEKVVGTVRAKEYTVECNPATAGRDYFARLKNAGVNRLSIGLQSADNGELKRLGRLHSFEDFANTYRLAQSAGFDNINIDLMFGIPGQTIKSWKGTLACAVSFEPAHISCYSLIVEEGTPFYNMELDLPDEETEREMYRFAVEFLEQHGYVRYEISNFAKPGFECRHNIKYWKREEYFGFGAGAHSLIGNVRCENPHNVQSYIDGAKPEKTVLTAGDIREEYVFLALRMAQGIDLEDYKKSFGKDLIEGKSDKINLYKSLGLLKQENGRLFLTLDGVSVSNTIMSEIM